MEIQNRKIAHRGVFNNTSIPENSMSAFKKAISLHLGIELDVQLTKDNVLIVFHDDNLYRMTGINQDVSKAIYSDIKKYHLLDSKETIPTLQEVLELVQDKVFLDIEIKSTRKKREIVDLLEKTLYGYHNYVLQSFDPRIVRYLKKKNPTMMVGYLMNRSINLYHIFLNSKLMIRYSKADFLAIHKKLLDTKKIQELKKKMPIFVWTIKKKDNISDEDYILICNDII